MKISKAKGTILLSGLMSAALLLGPSGLTAQVPAPQQQQQQEPAPDYSDEQIGTFVAATIEVMEVQENYQGKMESAIEEEGLTTQEFQTMAQSQQTGQETEMTEEKQESFANAMTEVMSIQQEMNQEMQTAVQENEMTVEEYQQMAMHIQQSPELSEKVDKMMEDEK